MNYNRVTLAGNLTRDPELRYTPKGTAVVKAGLAINRTWTGEDGVKKEEVTFVDFEAWGRMGENLAQYMRKGSLILVEGRLKLDSWEDKNTKAKMHKLKVVAETIQFGPQAAGERSERPRPAAKPASEPLEGDGPPESDDVPF